MVGIQVYKFCLGCPDSILYYLLLVFRTSFWKFPWFQDLPIASQIGHVNQKNYLSQQLKMHQTILACSLRLRAENLQVLCLVASFQQRGLEDLCKELKKKKSGLRLWRNIPFQLNIILSCLPFIIFMYIIFLYSLISSALNSTSLIIRICLTKVDFPMKILSWIHNHNKWSNLLLCILNIWTNFCKYTWFSCS